MDRRLRALLSRAGKAISDYGMISGGDRIAVGVSGGKDSLTLLYALNHFRRVAPIDFDVLAITVSMGTGTDLSPISHFCKDVGVEFHIEETQIGPIVFQTRRPPRAQPEKSRCCRGRRTLRTVRATLPQPHHRAYWTRRP